MTSPSDKLAGHLDVRTLGSTDALPVAPALGVSLDAAQMPRESTLVTHRILLISVLAVILGAAAAWVAQLLMLLINLITDICFYGRVSDVLGPHARQGSFVLSPADNHLGAWVIVLPAIGGLVVGVMARYGSRAIRGHGIPEAMEQVLTQRAADSRRASPSSSRCRRRSRSAPAGRSAPKGRSSPPAARWARSSASCCA